EPDRTREAARDDLREKRRDADDARGGPRRRLNQGDALADLNRIVSSLQVARQELLEQLDAIDKALAALSSAPVASAAIAEPAAVSGADVVPTRVKSRRVLDDAHKEAMAVGRRKAR